MQNDELKEYDFTEAAWESLYDAVDDTNFGDQDAVLIYRSLQHKLKLRSFGEYLQRYIYIKAGLTEPFSQVPLREYQTIIRCAFSDNHTPPSFTPTTAKLSALSKNWLTQQTVKRNVVFLLGFGLGMDVSDVNTFLTKGLREHQINPKDPFEVICWYCYKKQFGYLKFEQLWNAYKALAPNSTAGLYSEHTVGVRTSMLSINSEEGLFAHLSRLKTDTSMSVMGATARTCFQQLYDEARDMIAALYNSDAANAHQLALEAYIRKLSCNDRLFDYEKQQRIEQFRTQQKVFSREDISESDLEHIICSAIPKDRHGNLTPGKASKLNAQFDGKRFSRQRIGDILSGKADVTRFDLITLSFFIFSQKTDSFPDPKNRYIEFLDSTNAILEKCFLGKLYVPNPYECFVLMCILSDDPLGTYADVWELSYEGA